MLGSFSSEMTQAVSWCQLSNTMTRYTFKVLMVETFETVLAEGALEGNSAIVGTINESLLPPSKTPFPANSMTFGRSVRKTSYIVPMPAIPSPPASVIVNTYISPGSKRSSSYMWSWGLLYVPVGTNATNWLSSLSIFQDTSWGHGSKYIANVTGTDDSDLALVCIFEGCGLGYFSNNGLGRDRVGVGVGRFVGSIDRGFICCI
mmetsp:Transcript_14230/g.33116  ORF Transcript_14230/g.33116 Transcript_14230/m.33116 type:complete len:204 (-) Transcript_14230:2045-2656(-)